MTLLKRRLPQGNGGDCSGEKLLTGRRPMRNWTRRTMSSLFLRKKITLYLFLGNQQKLLSSELHFLTPICTKSFVSWGFAPDPTVRAYSAPRPSSCIHRVTLTQFQCQLAFAAILWVKLYDKCFSL